MTLEELIRKMEEDSAKTDKAWKDLEEVRSRTMANIEARHKSLKEDIADLMKELKKQEKSFE